MDLNNLIRWDYLFINCNTTYMQIAFHDFASINKNDSLLYLADCELIYTKDIDEDSSNKITDPAINPADPFYYPPFKLYKNNEVLFNQKSFGNYLKFLKTNFKIKSKIIFAPLSRDSLKESLQEGLKNNEFQIINVDVHDCPHLASIYKGAHGRHGLLVTAFDNQTGIVDIIDTLSPKIIKMDINDLAAGFNASGFLNTIVKINGNEFTSSIGYAEQKNAFLMRKTALTFVGDFSSDLGNYIRGNFVSRFDKNFHYARYLNSIRYQLLPYLKMRSHLLSVNSLNHPAQEMKDSIALWELISDILWNHIPKNNDDLYKTPDIESYNIESIFEIVNRLQVLEDNINREIEKLK